MQVDSLPANSYSTTIEQSVLLGGILGKTLDVQTTFVSLGGLIVEYDFRRHKVLQTGAIVGPTSFSDIWTWSAGSVSSGSVVVEAKGKATWTGSLLMSNATAVLRPDSSTVSDATANLNMATLVMKNSSLVVYGNDVSFSAGMLVQMTGSSIIFKAGSKVTLPALRFLGDSSSSIVIESSATVTIAGVTVFGAFLRNSGTLLVASGSCQLTSGGSYTAGSRVFVTPGTLAQFQGTHVFLVGANMTSDGTVELMPASSLGGSASLALGGLFRWSGGSLLGSSTIVPTLTSLVSMDITDGAARGVMGMQLIVAGTAKALAGMTLQLSPNAVLSIAKRATLTVAGSGGVSGGSLDVAGNFTFRGPGAFDMAANVTCAGDVALLDGNTTLHDSIFWGGLSLFPVARLRLVGGTTKLGAAVRLSWLGTVEHMTGSLALLSSQTIPASLAWSGGDVTGPAGVTLRWLNNATLSNSLGVNGVAVTFAAFATSAASFNLGLSAGGSVAIDGMLALAGGNSVVTGGATESVLVRGTGTLALSGAGTSLTMLAPMTANGPVLLTAPNVALKIGGQLSTLAGPVSMGASGWISVEGGLLRVLRSLKTGGSIAIRSGAMSLFGSNAVGNFTWRAGNLTSVSGATNLTVTGELEFASPATCGLAFVNLLLGSPTAVPPDVSLVMTSSVITVPYNSSLIISSNVRLLCPNGNCSLFADGPLSVRATAATVIGAAVIARSGLEAAGVASFIATTVPSVFIAGGNASLSGTIAASVEVDNASLVLEGSLVGSLTLTSGSARVGAEDSAALTGPLAVGNATLIVEENGFDVVGDVSFHPSSRSELAVGTWDDAVALVTVSGHLVCDGSLSALLPQLVSGDVARRAWLFAFDSWSGLFAERVLETVTGENITLGPDVFATRGLPEYLISLVYSPRLISAAFIPPAANYLEFAVSNELGAEITWRKPAVIAMFAVSVVAVALMAIASIYECRNIKTMAKSAPGAAMAPFAVSEKEDGNIVAEVTNPGVKTVKIPTAVYVLAYTAQSALVRSRSLPDIMEVGRVGDVPILYSDIVAVGLPKDMTRSLSLPMVQRISKRWKPRATQGALAPSGSLASQNSRACLISDDSPRTATDVLTPRTDLDPSVGGDTPRDWPFKSPSFDLARRPPRPPSALRHSDQMSDASSPHPSSGRAAAPHFPIHGFTRMRSISFDAVEETDYASARTTLDGHTGTPRGLRGYELKRGGRSSAGDVRVPMSISEVVVARVPPSDQQTDEQQDASPQRESDRSLLALPLKLPRRTRSSQDLSVNRLGSETPRSPMRKADTPRTEIDPSPTSSRMSDDEREGRCNASRTSAINDSDDDAAQPQSGRGLAGVLEEDEDAGIVDEDGDEGMDVPALDFRRAGGGDDDVFGGEDGAEEEEEGGEEEDGAIWFEEADITDDVFDGVDMVVTAPHIGLGDSDVERSNSASSLAALMSRAADKVRTFSLKDYLRNAMRRVWSGFKRRHRVLSLFFGTYGNMTRFRQVLYLNVSIYTYFLVNAFLFARNVDSGRRAAIAFFSALMVIPVSLVGFLLSRIRLPASMRPNFKDVNDLPTGCLCCCRSRCIKNCRMRWLMFSLPHFFIYPLTIVCMLYIVLAGYLTLLYGVAFTPDVAAQWLVSTTVTIAFDILVQQPVIIFTTEAVGLVSQVCCLSQLTAFLR